MEYPKTVEELYETLKAFKEKDANGNGDSTDEIPVSGDTNASGDLEVMSAFGLPVEPLPWHRRQRTTRRI